MMADGGEKCDETVVAEDLHHHLQFNHKDLYQQLKT